MTFTFDASFQGLLEVPECPAFGSLIDAGNDCALEEALANSSRNLGWASVEGLANNDFAVGQGDCNIFAGLLGDLFIVPSLEPLAAILFYK